MVHVAPDSCLFEIHSACLNLTLPTQSWHPPIPPSLAQWAGPWPLPINPAPAYRPLLGTEARPAVEASPVAIRTMAAVNRLEHFCSSVSAIWATHLFTPPSVCHPTKLQQRKRLELGVLAPAQFASSCLAV